MKLLLRPVNHSGPRKNRYCGPSALSILTGLDTGRTAALLRRVSGKRSIKGTYSGWMRKALRELGIDSFSSYTGYWVGGKPRTFVQWLKDTKDKRGDGTYLISCGHHWIVVQGRRCACGITGKVTSFKGCSKRRGRVKEVWSLMRVEQVNYDKVIPQFVAPVDTDRKVREEAKRLGDLYQLDIDQSERPDGVFWVYPPAQVDGLDFPDPRADEHYAHDWAEVLDMAREYAAAINTFRAEAKTSAAPRVDPSIDTISLDSTAQSATVIA